VRVFTRLVVLAGFSIMALAVQGCEDKKAAPPAPPAAAANTPPPTAAPPPAAATVAPSGQMAHCPNTVDGATTAISDVEGGVQILVTAKGEPAVGDIRARAKKIVEASKTQAATVHHSGNGEGGGAFGRCPIVLRNTTIDVADAEGGSKITVKPEKKEELDWLRRESRERQVALGAPNSIGAGKNKMSHCPSTVTGALTKLDDAKDGVTVTVTAKGADGTKEIRDRVKHLLEVAKTPAPSTAHDGNGHGGGVLGRCPIVLKDTTIAAKDVEGGAQISVKAKTAADAEALRKEARDRATSIGGM
jgi:TusA-related sulfurtransferase